MLRHVSPPSVDLNTPSDRNAMWLPTHNSPVPTYIVLGVTGSIAIAPIVSVVCLSNVVFHDSPPSVVFHTPPAAPPRKMISERTGCTATARTRPPRFVGPISLHCAAANRRPPDLS